MDIYTLECDTEDVVLFQGCLYKSAREVPDELKDVLDKETFEKARLYQIDKESLDFGQVSTASSKQPYATFSLSN